MKGFKITTMTVIAVSLFLSVFALELKARPSERTRPTGSVFHSKSAEEMPVNGAVKLNGVSAGVYSQMAKVTMSDASKAALKSINGQLTSAALENEDGSLVYAIEILDRGGARHEVLVDAGDGKILRKERKIASTSNGKDDDDEADGEVEEQ